MLHVVSRDARVKDSSIHVRFPFRTVSGRIRCQYPANVPLIKFRVLIGLTLNEVNFKSKAN